MGKNRRIYTQREIGIGCYGEEGPFGNGTWVHPEVLAEEEAVSKLKVPKKKKKKKKKPKKKSTIVAEVMLLKTKKTNLLEIGNNLLA